MARSDLRDELLDDDSAVVEAVLSHYRASLAGSPLALEWLRDHGIDAGVVVDAFGLGFADRSLGRSLPTGAAGRRLRAQLHRAGIIRTSGHENFRGCVVMPIRDGTGRVVQVQGRRVHQPKRSVPTPPESLWLPEPRTGIWHPEALTSPEVVIADSVLDGLVWRSAGYRHVIAPGGPEGLPQDLGVLLARAGVTRALLALARTPAGDQVAAALTDLLTSASVECFRVVFSYGGDAAMTAAEARDATAALGERLRTAVWIGRGPTPQENVRPGRKFATSAPAVGRSVTASPGPANSACAPTPAITPREHVWPAGHAPSPVPLPAPPTREVLVEGGELRMDVGALGWRVRGLDRVTGSGSLRVTVSLCHADTEALYLDVVDLFCARARQQFLVAAAEELKVSDAEALRRDLNRVLLACEDRVLDLQREPQQQRAAATPAMTTAEEQAALELLRDPQLLDRIAEDIAALGVIGERDNALLAYLVATSRLLDSPLALLVQSSSGAGKTTVTEAVLGLMPAEARVCLSAITGQSLFYLDEAALTHKVLSVAETDGAARATYPLRLLTTDGELSIASTGKHQATGGLATRTYRVQGPVALFLTTSAATVNDELANRAISLGVDEDQDQTRAILAMQRHEQTTAGLFIRHDRQALRTLHANAQRLLEPVAVVNPFAQQMSFNDRRLRARRDQPKLLTLIRAVTLLHQHQRPRRRLTRRGVEVVFIEATAEDVATAERLAGKVAGRPELADLAPQTRRLLKHLDHLVNATGHSRQCQRRHMRFTRRQAREYTGWSDYALRLHLARLVELEYVAAHRAGNAFAYELLWSALDQHGDAALCGDLDNPAAVSRAARGDVGEVPRQTHVGD